MEREGGDEEREVMEREVRWWREREVCTTLIWVTHSCSGSTGVMH